MEKSHVRISIAKFAILNSVHCAVYPLKSSAGPSGLARENKMVTNVTVLRMRYSFLP